MSDSTRHKKLLGRYTDINWYLYPNIDTTRRVAARLRTITARGLTIYEILNHGTVDHSTAT